MTAQIENFPGTFPGTIKGVLDPEALTKKADLVCIGEVETVEDEARIQYLVNGKPLDFIRKIATVRLERVEKGRTDRPRIRIEFLQSDTPSSLERIEPGERATLFLKKANDRYRFADVTTSKAKPDR